MDCFASAIGILSVSEIEPRYKQEPYSVLKRGYNVALAIALVCFGIACRCMLYTEKAEDAWKYFYACGIVGILCGYCFVFIAQFYTDYAFPPVRKIAEASTTGSGTNVIAGVGVGLELGRFVGSVVTADEMPLNMQVSIKVLRKIQESIKASVIRHQQ